MSKDKRRQPRLDANLFSELVSSSGDKLGRGVVVDVSLSGLGLDTEADLTVNDKVICHIEIPLTLEATVMRRDVKGQLKRYGLRFDNQSIFDRIVFRRILKGSRHTRKLPR